MLEIKNLSKTYGNGVKAIDNVNLSIEKGMFGLLGPNGAGKSSLMRTIATLQQQDEGSITFNGVDTQSDPQKIRQILGYLPQDFDVYPRISANDLLDHMAILKGIVDKTQRKDSVESLLVQTNLWDVRKKAVSTFSGGMRQRFGIAQALLGDPDLIIVDEPTAGLDPEERNRFHNLLSDIGENKVVILSTHIVDDVEELCSKLAVLVDGKILSTGEPQHLVDSLSGRIWRKLISKQQLKDHQDRYDIISTRLKAGQTVIHAMADQQPDDSFEQLSPDLEDVYFSTLFKSRQAA